ncbi:MAG TPA: kynureninase [Gammaproteobacteria bacterium]|nr:kynureninase [Gammaproteobacteria bacterium]
MNYRKDKDFAIEQDRDDPLAQYRDQFHLPQTVRSEPDIYLCGNSLGLQPKTAIAWVEQELADWARLGVKGHTEARHPWLPYHERVTDKLAEVVGARPDEVVAMNTLSVNLHLMMVSFYRPTPNRYKILIERSAFPSDHYAVQSQLRFHGFDPADALIEIGNEDGTIELDEIEDVITRNAATIALVLLPGVQYLSGQCLPMATIARLGHEAGAQVGLDLAHAVGNVPLALHDWNVDFAVWCHYKYMNSGPGAVGGCFVHNRHARENLPRFAGWWGHDKKSRFDMGSEFQPIPGAEGWQLSNPPIFSLAPLAASLELFIAAGMPALREKSVRLTGYLEFLLAETLGGRVGITTPADPDARGCQLSLRLAITREAARETFERIAQAGVTCDWREPNIVRVAPTPLYNRYQDVFDFVHILKDAVNGH